MQRDWQVRLDFLLALAGMIVITLIVFREIAPQIYIVTLARFEQVGSFFHTISDLISGTTRH